MFRFCTTSTIRPLLTAFCVVTAIAVFWAGSSHKFEQSDSVVSVAKNPDQRLFDFAVRQPAVNEILDIVVCGETSPTPQQATLGHLSSQLAETVATGGVISNQNSLYFLRVALKA